MGNTASILNMLRRVGGDAVITSAYQQIQKADALILPGVGAFDNAMQKLNATGLGNLIKHCVVEKQIPLLGICLGMQLLFDKSEEGKLPGLGLVPGVVERFNFTESGQQKLKIPHMGWNIAHARNESLVFKNFLQNPRFYFVHSYHAVCRDHEHIAATCDYGYPFTCAIQKNNIYAVQFHPEKSHKFGVQLFKNFLEQLC